MWNMKLLLLLIVSSTSVMAQVVVQPISGFSPSYENYMYDNFKTHPCRRLCILGEYMTCYYKLYIHDYQMMGPECIRCLNDTTACDLERCIYGDGIRMPLRLINYQFPGPAIEVCQGDTLIVDIYNNLVEETTIHWHGIHMKKTPESDGVPMVTQYGIRPGTAYRVCFEVEEDGTEWYHSHMHWQRAEGVWSILIIRTSWQQNPHANLYDFDDSKNSLLIHDVGLNGVPRNIVINGKGRSIVNSWPINDPRNRYHRSYVAAKRRYRMRVVFNGVSNCPVEISIQNHRLLVISTDGNSIVPVYADAVQMTSGERFDFIVYTNQTVGVYWIKVKGMTDCENMTQYAILHYDGVPNNQFPNSISALSMTMQAQPSPVNVIVNALAETTPPPPAPVSQTMGIASNPVVITNNNLATLGLRSLQPMPCQLGPNPVRRYISFGLMVTNNQPFLQVDRITYKSTNISMLQGRHLYNEDQQYCNRDTLRNANIDCGTVHCQCTNVIRIPANKCVELIVVNYMPTTHPFHGHGYTYRLIGQGQILNDSAALRNIEETDRQGRLFRLPPDYPAVEKDTVQVPPEGYIILSYFTNNPGYWLIHCHIERHPILGMMAVVKVGENNQIKNITSVTNCFGGYC